MNSAIRCPNHKVPLLRTNTPGVGICPISQARFEYKADESKKKRVLKTDGTVSEETEWKVIGND